MKKIQEINIGLQENKQLKSMIGHLIKNIFLIHAVDRDTGAVYQDRVVIQLDGGHQLEVGSLPLHHERSNAMRAHVYPKGGQALEIKITEPEIDKSIWGLSMGDVKKTKEVIEQVEVQSEKVFFKP